MEQGCGQSQADEEHVCWDSSGFVEYLIIVKNILSEHFYLQDIFFYYSMYQ